MEKVYLLWMSNDETIPVLIGAAETYKQAEAMKTKVIEAGFNDMELDIDEFQTNTVTINDVPYMF